MNFFVIKNFNPLNPSLLPFYLQKLDIATLSTSLSFVIFRKKTRRRRSDQLIEKRMQMNVGGSFYI